MPSGYFAKSGVLNGLMNGRQHILPLQQFYQLDIQPQFSSDVQRD